MITTLGECKLAISSYFDSVISQIDYYTEKTIAHCDYRDNELLVACVNQRREKQIKLVKEMEQKNLANVDTVDLKTDYEESQLMKKLFKEFCFTSEFYGWLFVIVTDSYRSDNQLKLFQMFLQVEPDDMSSQTAMKAFNASREFKKLIECATFSNATLESWTSSYIDGSDYYFKMDDLFSKWGFHFHLGFETETIQLENLASRNRPDFNIKYLTLSHDSGEPHFDAIEKILDIPAGIERLELQLQIYKKQELFKLVSMLQRHKKSKSIRLKLDLQTQNFLNWFKNHLIRPQVVQKFVQLSKLVASVHLVVDFNDSPAHAFLLDMLCSDLIEKLSGMEPSKRTIEFKINYMHKMIIDESNKVEISTLEDDNEDTFFDFNDLKQARWIKENLRHLDLTNYWSFENKTLTKSFLTGLEKMDQLSFETCNFCSIAPDAFSATTQLEFIDIQNLDMTHESWNWSFLAPIKSKLLYILWANNSLTKISYRIFEGMTGLRNLVVIKQKIDNVELDENGALFPSLTNLEWVMLDVSGSQAFSSEHSRERRIFHGLNSLKKLAICLRDERDGCRFLCDSDPEYRLPNIERMKLLIEAMSGGIKLSKECFRSFVNLKRLAIKVPRFEDIEPSAFSYLSNLQVLTIESMSDESKFHPSLVDGLVSLRILQTRYEKEKEFVYFSNLNRFVLVLDLQTSLPSIELLKARSSRDRY